MSSPVRILLALILGIAAGAALAVGSPGLAAPVTGVTDTVGAWLDGLRMTIIPLVVSLLITGIAQTASAAQAGGKAARTLGMILGFLWLSSLIGWALSDLFWQLAPMPAEAGAALKAAMGGQSGKVPPPPGLGAFFRSIVPSNPIASAAADQTLPVILFAGVFGFAITRLPDPGRALLTGFFAAVADAMIVVINWVLWLAPLGVLALAVSVGVKAGLGAAGALAHYVVTLSAIGLAVGLLGYVWVALARGNVGRFARALLPVQALAISTQSSLACLPLMLRASEDNGVPPATAGLSLPMAVALFRATGPAMNLGVALYVAHWLGVQLSPAQVVAGIALGATTTLGAVSLPGQVSFVSSIGPIALALGLPLEPLLLLIAVEPIPDIFRTVGNVTNDGATVAVERWGGEGQDMVALEEPAR